MRFLVIACVLLFSLAAHGQSAVRRIDSLTNLVASIDPAAVDTGYKVSYLVDGYYSFGDWGTSAREFTATKTVGTTNRGTILRSSKNTNYFWRSADIGSPTQNIQHWGATSGRSNDASGIISEVIQSGASIVRIPNGSYALRNTIYVTNSVRIIGDNKDTTTLLYYGTNYAIQIGGGTNFAIRGASLENLLIIGWEDPPYNGSYATSNALGLVRVYGAVRGYLKRLRLSNAMTGTGLKFEKRAWYWDVNDVTPFDTKYGIWILDQNPGAGDLVDTINIQNSVLSGCDWGAVLGDPTVAAGSGERGVAVINFTDTSIEGNRIGGLWVNQSELVTLNNTYFEANGRATNGHGVHVRLGNSLDTNAWSASGVRLIGTRWADTTNSVEIYSANNVTIKDNDHQGVKGTGVPIVFMTTNHIDVQVDGDFARQYPSLGYNPPVAWMDGIGSSVTKYTAGPTNGPLRRQSASAEFGDDSGSWMSLDRVFNVDRFVSANSTNGAAGIFASRFGATGQSRAGVWTDGSEVYVGGGREASGGGEMPINIVMNSGNPRMTLGALQTVNPNRFVIGETNGYDKLTVHGNAMIGSPTNYGGFNAFDRQLSVISLDQSENVGLVFFSYDGTTNRRLTFGLDPTVGEVVIQPGYSSGGEMPFIIRSALGDNIVSLINSGLTIRNGAGLTVNGSTITNFAGTNLAILGSRLNVVGGSGSGLDADLLDGQSGAYYLDRANHTGTQSYTTITGLGGLATVNDAPSDGNTYGRNNGSWTVISAATYTNFWPDLTNAFIAGANIAFAYDTGNETITISSSGGGGATNGSAVSVDGVYLSALNLADSAELGVTAAGTNVTYAIVSGSVATNKIDSTFYAWVNSKGGSVYADGTSITNIKSSPSILFSTAAQEVTLALSNTAVTPGSYTTANITVDAQGRITAAANGSASTNSGTVVSVNGVQQGTLNLTNSSKIAGTLAGTNLSYSIVANSLDTNDISSAFYTWIDGQGGGGGDVYAASNNVFTGANTFTGPITGNVFSVSTLILANPIGLTAIGTNLADAQDELQLTPGVYTMAYDLDLQQLATMTWSNGVMAYHNGSTITNLVSTSTGRSLLTASSATNGRDVLEVGQLDQSAYSVAWDGVTNATPTLNALYDKIQSLPGGSNNISSWNTNYFSVTGGYLDWIGGSVSGGGGVTWIGNLGLSPLTNAATTTNVLLANFEVTTNKSVTTDGRFLEGGLDLMITNASSINAAFNLRTKVNGTTVSDAQRSMATSTTYEFHTMRFRLVRESSTTAHLTLLGERWGGSVPSVGYGTFGSSGGEDLLVATNIAWNWGQSNTLSMEIGMSWSGTPTTNAIGVQRIAANLYNPGDGSAGSSSGTNLVFTVNGVTFDPVIITNSATVTWATNANGHIQATASVSGGGGLGTNIFVNGSLVQPAMLTNGYGLSWSTSGSQIIPVVTNNFGSGYANGFLPLYAGVDNKLTGDLHFLQNSDIRLALMEADQLVEPLYRQWGFRAFGGKFELGTLATNDINWNETWIEFDPTDDSWGSNIVTFANSGFNNRVDFETPVEFGETVRFGAGVEFTGTTSFQTLNVGTLTVTNPFPARSITNATASRFAVFGADNRLTNDVAETGTGAPVRATAPTLSSPTLSAGVLFSQSTLSAHSAVTNFVVDPTVNPYQIINPNITDSFTGIRFLHATNVSAGRQATVLVLAGTNASVTVNLNAQFAYNTNAVTLTTGQILPVSFYGYGSNNTNVIATVGTVYTR